jgi:hypothetical protein
MHTPRSPLARTLEPAADTLPARQLKGSDNINPSALIKDHVAAGRFIRLQRVETRHLQPPTTPHGVGPYIGNFGPFNHLFKTACGTVLIYSLTSHKNPFF